MATTIVYSDDTEYLRQRIIDAAPGDIVLARTASNWRGEVEQADNVEVKGDFAEIKKAYNLKDELKVKAK